MSNKLFILLLVALLALRAFASGDILSRAELNYLAAGPGRCIDPESSSPSALVWDRPNVKEPPLAGFSRVLNQKLTAL